MPPRSFTFVISVILFLLAAVGCGKNKNNSNNPTLDSSVVSPPDLPDLSQPDVLKWPGQACKDNNECTSNICVSEQCRKECQDPSSCDTGQDCTSEDGIKYFCNTPKYNTKIGEACVITGKCLDSDLQCLPGSTEDLAMYSTAYCSAGCEYDTDCPPRFMCMDIGDDKKMCVRRGFCSRCLFDGQCASNSRCIKQGKESFCAKSCTKDRTECPRYADCKDVGGGEYYCIRKAGSCVGDGKICAPCITEADCEKGSLCLTYTYSRESFCSPACVDEKCPGDQYECNEVAKSDGTTLKQCSPKDEGTPEDENGPTCTTALSPMMEEGDTMDDFSMVGYVDSNQDGSLAEEELRVINLSDFSDKAKIILFNVSAGWCNPCRDETQGFTDLMRNYGDKGLVIVQTIFDSDEKGQKPTRAFLNRWIEQLTPAASACGIDPGRNSILYNTAGTTPLNMILDAKTRKVLKKINGTTALESLIKEQLGVE